MKSSEPVEHFFLKYAFPCAHVLVASGKLSETDHDSMIEDFKKGKYPPREIIESYFIAAFRRLKKLAKEMNSNHWDYEVMKEYWHNAHNKNIDEREGGYANFPDAFCDFCKTHIAKVMGLLPNNFILVKYGNVERPVSREFLKRIPKVGESVRIHHAFAAEFA